MEHSCLCPHWQDVIVHGPVQHHRRGQYLGCIESLRSGCTTIFDYMVDHTDTDVYAAILQSFDDVGIQGILGRGLRDRQAEKPVKGGIGASNSVSAKPLFSATGIRKPSEPNTRGRR